MRSSWRRRSSRHATLRASFSKRACSRANVWRAKRPSFSARAASDFHGSRCSQRSTRSCACWNAAEPAIVAALRRTEARLCRARASRTGSGPASARVSQNTSQSRAAPQICIIPLSGRSAARACEPRSSLRKACSAERSRRTPHAHLVQILRVARLRHARRVGADLRERRAAQHGEGVARGGILGDGRVRPFCRRRRARGLAQPIAALCLARGFDAQAERLHQALCQPHQRADLPLHELQLELEDVLALGARLDDAAIDAGLGANAVAERERTGAALEAGGEHRPQAPREAHDVQPRRVAHCLAREQRAVEASLAAPPSPTRRATRARPEAPAAASGPAASRGRRGAGAMPHLRAAGGNRACRSRRCRGGCFLGGAAKGSSRGARVAASAARRNFSSRSTCIASWSWGDRWDSNPQQPESQTREGTLTAHLPRTLRFQDVFDPTPRGS